MELNVDDGGGGGSWQCWWLDRPTQRYSENLTRAKNGGIAVASFAVCRYLKQVTIKSRVQITE